MWEGNKSQAAALESFLLSGSLSALQRHAIRQLGGMLKWWYKLVTMPEDRYPKKSFSQD